MGGQKWDGGEQPTRKRQEVRVRELGGLQGGPRRPPFVVAAGDLSELEIGVKAVLGMPARQSSVLVKITK